MKGTKNDAFRSIEYHPGPDSKMVFIKNNLFIFETFKDKIFRCKIRDKKQTIQLQLF